MMMRKGKIRLWASGDQGIGKRLLLDKIKTFLSKEGMVVTGPVLHKIVDTWFIEIYSPGGTPT